MRAHVSIPTTAAFAGLLLTSGFTACKRATPPPRDTGTASLAPSSDAFLVLPGDYSQRTTVADLEARFGKSNVRKETEPNPRIVLYPDDPARRAYVTFFEDDFKELARISVSDPGSLWRGKHGTHIGMSFAKLRELNGKPFYFFFDDQKRGSVHDSWSPSLSDEDSTLGAFDVTEGDHMYFNIELGFADPAGSGQSGSLPVDEQVSSDDPRLQHLGKQIIVTGLGASNSLDDEWE